MMFPFNLELSTDICCAFLTRAVPIAHQLLHSKRARTLYLVTARTLFTNHDL